MGWLDAECRTPNGQPVLHMQELDGWMFVFTQDQTYTMLQDGDEVRLVPCHAIMSEPRRRQ